MKPAALRALLVFSLVSALAVQSLATVLTISPGAKTRAAVTQQADAAVRGFASAYAQLTLPSRKLLMRAGRYNPDLQLSFPTVVRISGSGSGGGSGNGGGILRGGNNGGIHPDFNPPQGGDLVLQFDSSGAEAFPAAYQQLLQNVFNSAKSTLDLVFGMPSVGGNVHVANFDATIGDRDAIAGGYYLPDNGNGVPEIRFPIYNANESAAVNFIHCLLLAYLGADQYAWDGFEEGLVRAVTMRVSRIPSALPGGLDSGVIESVLDNSYDILEGYDWSNQRPLCGPVFIAPNLRALPLPVSGGSGPYLMRYMMAGSAWAKVLVEYPTFAANLNALLYANPSLGSNLPGLTTAGQSVLTSQRPGNAVVEGVPFASWLQHQYVLDPTLTQGNKVLTQAIPITSSLTTGDFGFFIFEATYFSTDGSGNETLLSGTSYPILWDAAFNRIVTDVQDEQMTLTASDGSIVPNLPDLFSGSPYRAAVDIPIGDQLQRMFVPSGAIATFANQTPNDFYGTVEGVDVESTDTLRIDILIGGTVIASAPVTNNAFGITIGTTAGYNNYASLTLNVVRTRSGTDSTVYTRIVNKNPGSLDVDLQVGSDGTFNYSLGLAGGYSMIGLPIDPYLSDPTAILGVPAADLLLARYDSALANYDLYPSVEPLILGHGYFLNLPAAQNSFSISGRFAPGVSTSVPMKPGWNMITCPLNEVFQTTSIRVVHAADFPDTYADQLGGWIGTDFFSFTPGPPDPITGLPEGGTFNPATEFDPGVAYFVRVLAPEGVSFSFDPDTLLLQTSAPNPPGWRMQVTATAGGQSTVSIIGEAPNGSDTPTVTVDSPLPPAIAGGLQAYSINGANLFRDIRPMNTRQTFNMEVDGLTPGQNYVLLFKTISGLERIFSVIDKDTGKARSMFSGASWTLKATGTSAHFSVVVTR